MGSSFKSVICCSSTSSELSWVSFRVEINFGALGNWLGATIDDDLDTRVTGWVAS